jgi:hypothetical protein
MNNFIIKTGLLLIELVLVSATAGFLYYLYEKGDKVKNLPGGLAGSTTMSVSFAALLCGTISIVVGVIVYKEFKKLSNYKNN